MSTTQQRMMDYFGLATSEDRIKRHFEGEKLEQPPEGMEFRYHPDGRVAVVPKGKPPRFGRTAEGVATGEPSSPQGQAPKGQGFRLSQQAIEGRQQTPTTGQKLGQAADKAPETIEAVQPAAEQAVRERRDLAYLQGRTGYEENVEPLGDRLDSQINIPGVRAVQAGGVRAMMGTQGLISRVIGDQRSADEMWRESQSIGDEHTYVEKMVAGSVESIVQMAQGLALGGGAATVIGRFALGAAQDAAAEGREAGLEGWRLASHITGQAAAEGLVTAAFQMAGLGGLESLKGPAKQGLREAVKHLGLRTLAEIPEELAVELVSAIASQLQTLDDVTPAQMRDTVVQTVMTVGLANPMTQALAGRGQGQAEAEAQEAQAARETEIEAGADEVVAANPEVASTVFQGDPDPRAAIKEAAILMREKGLSLDEAITQVKQERKRARAKTAKAAPATPEPTGPVDETGLQPGTPVTFKLGSSTPEPIEGEYVGIDPDSGSPIVRRTEDRMKFVLKSPTATLAPLTPEPPPAEPEAEQAQQDIQQAEAAQEQPDATQQQTTATLAARAAEQGGTVIAPENYTPAEKAASDFLAARNVPHVITQGLVAQGMAVPGEGIVINRQSDEAALLGAAAHEAAHHLGIDALEGVFTQRQLKSNEKKYLNLLRNKSEDLAARLEADPERLRREAVAYGIGEMIRQGPAARARLFKKNRNLAQRILDNLREIIANFGHNKQIADIIDEFEKGLGATTETRAQQDAEDVASQQIEREVIERNDRRDMEVAEQAVREASQPRPRAGRQVEQDREDVEKVSLPFVGPASIAESESSETADAVVELWQGDNGRWSVRITDTAGNVQSQRATPKEENARKWYEEAVGNLPATEEAVEPEVGVEPQPVEQAEEQAAEPEPEAPTQTPSQPARAKPKSSGEARVMRAEDIKAEEQAERTVEEEQRFTREEQASYRGLVKSAGKYAGREVSAETTDMVNRAMAFAVTGHNLSFTRAQQDRIDMIRGKHGPQVRESVWMAAVQDGDADAQAAIVANMVPYIMSLTRQYRAGDRVASLSYDELVLVGVEKAYAVLADQSKTKLEVGGDARPWRTLANRVKAEVGRQANPKRMVKAGEAIPGAKPVPAPDGLGMVAKTYDKGGVRSEARDRPTSIDAAREKTQGAELAAEEGVLADVGVSAVDAITGEAFMDEETAIARESLLGLTSELMQEGADPAEVQRQVIERARALGYSTEDLSEMFLPEKVKQDAERRAAMFLPDPAVTQTDNFRRWFGRSKIVNPDGTPKLVFHGTQFETDDSAIRNFTVFLPGTHVGTLWAATERAWLHAVGRKATQYATEHATGEAHKFRQRVANRPGVDPREVSTAGFDKAADRIRYRLLYEYGDDYAGAEVVANSRIYPLYARIENPLYMSDAQANSPDGIVNRAEEVAFDMKMPLWALEAIGDVKKITHSRRVPFLKAMESAYALLEGLGFDGIAYMNGTEDRGSLSYVVLRPDQLKSPYNRGSFGQPSGKPETFSLSVNDLIQDPDDILYLPAEPLEQVTDPDARDLRKFLSEVASRMRDQFRRGQWGASYMLRPLDNEIALRGFIADDGSVDVWNADADKHHLDVMGSSASGLAFYIRPDRQVSISSVFDLFTEDDADTTAMLLKRELEKKYPGVLKYDDMLSEIDGPPSRYKGLDFLPTKGPKVARLTPQEAQRRLVAAMGENPKITGRPDLANPMEDEEARRLMDVMDAAMEQAGSPEKQSIAQWKREADAIFQDPAQRVLIEQELDQGNPMSSPSHTFVAKRILNERADNAIGTMDANAWAGALRAGYGFRQGRTEVARVLASGFDEIKDPAERIREFVRGLLTDPPPKVLNKNKPQPGGQMPPMNDVEMSKYLKDIQEMFERWKEQGIDIQKLDELLAKNPSVVYKVVRDAQAVRQKHHGWSDPFAEIYRNLLMSSPLTFIRNALGGAYSVTDIVVTQPSAAIVEKFMPGANTRSVRGSVAGAAALLSPKALGRAIHHAAMTAYYEVPTFDLMTDAKGDWNKVEWKKHAAIGGNPILVRKPDGGAKLNQPPKDASMAERAKFRASQAKYVAGRGIRYPQLGNLVMDQFVKTMHAHAMVAATATTTGLQAGKRGRKLNAFVRQQVEDMGSDSWNLAITNQDTARAAFQAQSSGMTGALEDFLINARAEYPALHLIFPFIKTPIELVNESFWHTPGLGAIGMAAKLAEKHINKRDRAFAGGKHEVATRAAQQIIGLSMMAMLWNLVDEDDEDKVFNVTGAASYARGDRHERLGKEVVEPYFSIKLGDTWRSYRNIDPLTLTLAGTTSIIREMKKAIKGEQGYLLKGEKKGAAIQRLANQFAGMYGDIPALKVVGDMQKILSDYEYWGQRWVTDLGASFMPNVVRNYARSQDELRRDSRWLRGEPAPSAADRLGRAMYPSDGGHMGPPKVTVFGTPVEKDAYDIDRNWQTAMFLRMFQPFTEQWQPTGMEGRLLKMVVRWNAVQDKPENVRWFIEPRPDFQIDTGELKNERVQPNEEEWLLYQRLAGRLALHASKQAHLSRPWNFQQPQREDIEIMDKIVTAARRDAREAVKALVQLRLEDQPDRRSQVKAAIEEALSGLDPK